MFKEKWTLNENYDCQWEYIKEFEAEVNAVGREINDFIQKLTQDQK